MKTRYLLTLIFAFLLISTSCTHNDGDIGDLFGRWRVESLQRDGVDVQLYDDDTLLYTWSFQSSLIFITVIEPHNDHYDIRGTWKREGNLLRLNFGYKGNDGDKYYDPPENLGLVKDGVSDLEIVRLSSKEMILKRVSETGATYTYHLRKAY